MAPSGGSHPTLSPASPDFQPVGEELHNHVEDVIKDMGKFVQPITDQRSTKEYRYRVAMNILKDFILTIE